MAAGASEKQQGRKLRLLPPLVVLFLLLLPLLQALKTSLQRPLQLQLLLLLAVAMCLPTYATEVALLQRSLPLQSGLRRQPTALVHRELAVLVDGAEELLPCAREDKTRGMVPMRQRLLPNRGPVVGTFPHICETSRCTSEVTGRCSIVQVSLDCN